MELETETQETKNSGVQQALTIKGIMFDILGPLDKAIMDIAVRNGRPNTAERQSGLKRLASKPPAALDKSDIGVTVTYRDGHASVNIDLSQRPELVPFVKEIAAGLRPHVGTTLVNYPATDSDGNPTVGKLTVNLPDVKAFYDITGAKVRDAQYKIANAIQKPYGQAVSLQQMEDSKRALIPSQTFSGRFSDDAGVESDRLRMVMAANEKPELAPLIERRDIARALFDAIHANAKASYLGS